MATSKKRANRLPILQTIPIAYHGYERLNYHIPTPRSTNPPQFRPAVQFLVDNDTPNEQLDTNFDLIAYCDQMLLETIRNHEEYIERIRLNNLDHREEKFGQQIELQQRLNDLGMGWMSPITYAKPSESLKKSILNGGEEDD